MSHREKFAAFMARIEREFDERPVLPRRAVPVALRDIALAAEALSPIYHRLSPAMRRAARNMLGNPPELIEPGDLPINLDPPPARLDAGSHTGEAAR